MRKAFLTKLCVLALVAAMMLSVLVSCNTDGGTETEKQTDDTTETKIESTENTTESGSDEPGSENTTEQTGEVTTDETTAAVTEETTEEDDGCEHPYAATPEGHYKPTCDVCGKPDGKIMSHEWDDDVEDEGDVLLYSYYCTVCDYVAYAQEVSYDINIFVAPSDLIGSTLSGFDEPEVVIENGGAFARFTASSGSANSYISAYQGTIDDEMAGRYMVMKVRLGGSRSSVKFAVSTVASSALDSGVGSTAGRLSATAENISPSWSTIIVDLQNIATDTKGFIPDASGDYYIEELRIILDGGSTLAVGESLDIAYLMFCETVEEAQEFALSAAEGYYRYDDIMADSTPVTSGKVCDHKYTYTAESHSMQACDVCGAQATTDVDHVIGTITNGEEHIFGCVCGYELFKMTVSSDVNVFMGAGALAASAAGHSAWSGAEILYEEGSEAFARIYGKQKSDKGSDIGDSSKTWDPYSKGEIVTGQFLVIKYRIGNNGLGQSHLKLYTSTSRVTATDETDGLSLPASENDQWITVVADLAYATGNAKGTTYVADGDGNYAMTFLQVRLFSGQIANENAYTDIAFIAVCDSLAEAKGLILDETFYYKSTTSSGVTLKTDGGCVNHTVTESISNGKYTYVCEICGNKVAEKTVPASINKYLGTDYVLNGAVNYFQITPEKFGVDGDIPYARMVGQGKVAQIIWTRIGADTAGPFPENQINPLEVGKAKYLVIKMRSNNDIASLDLKVGTIIGDAKYSNVDNQVSTNILLPQDVLYGDKWTTFVIDLSTTMSGGWVPDADGNYKVSYFQITFNSSESNKFGSNTFFDFSYLAFCDSWDEIDELVDESSVRLVTSSGASVESGANGKCEAHTLSESIDGETYTYTCILCGEKVYERTVPASTNKFISPSVIATNTHYNVASSSQMVEGDLPFARLYHTGNSHINIWSVPAVGGNGQALSIDASTGQYLVMKFRTENLNYLSLSAGTGGTAETDVLSRGERRTGINNGWETMVLDLSSYANYQCNAPAGTTVQIRIDGFIAVGATSFTVDIAYVAIVDSIDEAVALIDDSKFNFYSSMSASAKEMETENASCDGEHTYVYNVNGEKYTLKCSICGATVGEKTVPESVNLYVSASDIAQSAEISNLCTGGTVIFEDGEEAYARLPGGSYHDPNGTDNYNQFHAYSNSAASIVTGKYLVIKFRVPENGIGQTSIGMYMGTKNNLPTNGNELVSIKVSEDNQWHVAVVNLDKVLGSKNVEEFTKDDNDEYRMRFISVRPFFIREVTVAATEDDYNDFAYLACCDSLEEVAALVEESTYEYYEANNVFTVYNTETGTPAN